METHPLADLFPAMSVDEYVALRDSIQEQGLQQPLMLYEGKVLDGRHRLRACLDLGLEPRVEEYTGDDPVGFVVACNIARRHLTVTERAKLGALLVEKWGSLRHGPLHRQLGIEGEAAVEIAGQRVGVGSTTVGRARYVQQADPELFDKMDGREGGTIYAAYERVRKRPTAPARRSSKVDPRSLDEKRAERAMRDEKALQLLAKVNGAALKAHRSEVELLEAIERNRDRYAVQSVVDTLTRTIGWIQVYIDAARDRLGREEWSA